MDCDKCACACHGCSESLRDYGNPSLHYIKEHGLYLPGIDTTNKRKLIQMYGPTMAKHLYYINNPGIKLPYFESEF